MPSLKWLPFETHSTERPSNFPDGQQTWWQLAAIQITGFTSLPILASSVLIIQQNTLFNAILTLTIGNLILWAIRLGIVYMSYDGRKSTLDIAHEYLGRTAAFLIGLLLLAATLAWFFVETTLASDALCRLLSIDEGKDINQFIQIGVLLGVCSTIICMDGMVVLRWFATLCLPVLFIALVCVIFSSNYELPLPANRSLNLSGLSIFLATNLGVSVDLPTFFRHSRSLKSSLTALAAIQIIGFGIGIGGLFLGSIIVPWSGIASTDFHSVSTILKSSLIVLVFLSVISTNASSIYSASIGWELVAPIFAGIKEYLIIGLGSTIIFVLATDVFSLDFLEKATGCSLVNLCVILAIAFLIRIKSGHSSRYQQVTYFAAWLVSSLVNILQITVFDDQYSTFWTGLTIGLLILFMAWGMKSMIYKIKGKMR